MIAKQCKGCPWKVRSSTDDIPGYCPTKHAALADTIAAPGSIAGLDGPLRVMSCHDSREGADRVCVGWAAHQLGPGNNIGLRLKASRDKWPQMQTVGEQHQTFEDTLP